MRALILPLALLLGGCPSLPYGGADYKPIITIGGPQFQASQFECGERPSAPDPTKATGKTAAIYEARLGAWGEGCANRLQSIGSTLAGSGQVAEPKR